MKLFLTLLGLAASTSVTAFALNKNDPTTHPSFDEFKHMYKKNYLSAQEHDQRKVKQG